MLNYQILGGDMVFDNIHYRAYFLLNRMTEKDLKKKFKYVLKKMEKELEYIMH